ncbi:MAG: ATP-binding protein [Polyangiaceae bacterium]
MRLDGTEVPIEISACRTTGDSAFHSIAFFRDITDRTEARRVVVESEARLRRFIESAPDGIAISRNGFFLYANPKALSLLGVADTDELRRTPIQELLSPEDVRTMNERIEGMVNEGRTFTPQEYRAVRGGGTSVEITSIPVEFEGGPAILGFARDVTERKALQSRLARIDRLASLGTLTAGVAHEVNNPLSVTSLSLEAMTRALDSGLDAEALHGLLAQAKSGVDRIARIVRDLRGFSRRDDELRAVDVRHVVTSAAAMVANEIRHRAAFSVECRDLPRVETSEGRLAQVVMNLLLNAAQAFERAAPEENRIVLRAGVENGGDVVLLEVQDNGPGIDDAHLPHLFDPFFTTKPVGEGTGLGLAICHGIVDAMGGTITVESRKGHGATFRVRLPTTPRDREAPPAQGGEDQATSRSRILVVDDEAGFALTLKYLLADEHDVVATTRPKEALDGILAEDASFDVVFCDLLMPGLTGMQIYAEVRSKKPHWADRFVFMTGGAFTREAIAFVAETTNTCLEKPFSPDVLRAAIARVVAARREPR